MNASIRSHGVNWQDVGMLKLRGGLGLDLKSMTLSMVDRQRERQDFQREAAPERLLYRLINDAHTTSADFANDSKVA